MKNAQQPKPITEVRVEEVFKVYSGRPGCGCGCRGKYRVNPSHLTFAKKEVGWDAYGEDEISLTSCKIMLKKMQSRVSEIESHTTAEGINIYAIETETRYLWLYTKPQVN